MINMAKKYNLFLRTNFPINHDPPEQLGLAGGYHGGKKNSSLFPEPGGFPQVGRQPSIYNGTFKESLPREHLEKMQKVWREK